MLSSVFSNQRRSNMRKLKGWLAIAVLCLACSAEAGQKGIVEEFNDAQAQSRALEQDFQSRQVLRALERQVEIQERMIQQHQDDSFRQQYQHPQPNVIVIPQAPINPLLIPRFDRTLDD
jgi:hypothetical protein